MSFGANYYCLVFYSLWILWLHGIIENLNFSIVFQTYLTVTCFNLMELLTFHEYIFHREMNGKCELQYLIRIFKIKVRFKIRFSTRLILYWFRLTVIFGYLILDHLWLQDHRFYCHDPDPTNPENQYFAHRDSNLWVEPYNIDSHRVFCALKFKAT